MKIQYNSHASIKVTQDDISIVTDPWFFEPIYGGMMWQYPRPKINIKQMIDNKVVSISHFHPDHFCPKSLNFFNKQKTLVLIPNLESMKVCEDFLRKNQFKYEKINDKESYDIGNSLSMTFFHCDNQVDSAQIITSKLNLESIYNMNDCFLDKDKLCEIGTKFNIKHAMIFFMGVGPFPGSFDMPMEEKFKIISRKEAAAYERAEKTLEHLKADTFTAYSNDMTWLRRSDLVLLNGSLKSKFYKYMKNAKNDIKSIPLESGDSIDFETKKVNINSNLIEDKSIISMECKVLAKEKTISEQIKKIMAKEKSYKIDLPKLNSDMDILCTTYNRLIKHKESLEKITYKISLNFLPENFNYQFTFEPKEKKVKISKGSDSNYFDLLVSIDSYLWGAVQQNFYNSEDLLNCRFNIKRDGPFTNIEDCFWDSISEIYKSNFSLIQDLQQSVY